MSRGLTTVLMVVVVTLACACTAPATREELPDLRPGQQPEKGSVEAGLWMKVDAIEQTLRTSGRVVDDPALDRYVRGIVCRLAPAYCGEIRVYVVRTPNFNATMAPNGYMEVWTGLMLRARNEAQLAYVLGHETGHYLRRHSVQRWEDLRTKTDIAAAFQVLAAGAGVGYAGDLAQLAAISSIFAFTRDQEREADDVGFDLVIRAGYDPAEAAEMWAALMRERDASGAEEPSVFFASHPGTDERIATLRAKAKAAPADTPRERGMERYLDATRAHRDGWLRDELRRRKFTETRVLLDNLLGEENEDGLLLFYDGEFYRMRAAPGDAAHAVASYERALAAGGAPPELQRSLGLVHWQAGRRSDARAAFQVYLARVPDARDREMIRSYIERLD